jgi:DNA-binding PadR family transcriptional regulator
VIKLKKKKTPDRQVGEVGEKIKISKKWILGFTELYALLFFKSHPNSSGYDLCKHVELEYSFRISFSKIYPLLKKLEEKRVISVKEDSKRYPPKKVYKLTSKGRKLIKEYKKVFLKFLDEF